MNATLSLALTHILSRLRDSMAKAQDHVTEAAAIYMEGLAADPSGWADMVAAAFPNAPRAIWSNLERVGRGQLVPLAITNGCAHTEIVATLPLSEQQKALTEGVKVWAGKGDDHRLVPLHLLTRAEFKQCIRDGRVLSLEEQRKVVADKQARRKTVSLEDGRQVKYEVDGKALILHECPVRLSPRDVRKILAALGE
jgi:hypothetical protein